MTQRYTSALVVVDMKNDFLGEGGYYDEIARVKSRNGGELSPADVDALAQVYQHPPPSCVIRDGYGDLVNRVAEIAAAALADAKPHVRAIISNGSSVRISSFRWPKSRENCCREFARASRFGDELRGRVQRRRGRCKCATQR